MVSPLWIAADKGDFEQVQHVLKEASAIDIEIKDEAGATPLVQAAKNGHGDIVKALLDAGADPTVSTSHGSIEQLTADATILELLGPAREKRAQADGEAASVDAAAGGNFEQPNLSPAPEGYPQDFSGYGQAPPPGSYLYYPPPFPGAMMPDGTPAPYYPPPPPPTGVSQPPEGNGNGSLPPPEIARLIPCRYFPACRYGPSCIFAHPQGPYFQGPLPPPAQYSAPYDPMAQPPYGGYYGVPQYPQPPPSANHLSPPQNPQQSLAPQPQHTHSGSEVTSPMQGPFNVVGAPPSMPYGVPVLGGYPPPGQMPLPQMSVGAPPAHQSGPQPNGVIYSPTSPVTQPPPMHQRDPSLLNGAPQFPQTDNAASHPVQPFQIPPQQEAYANSGRPQQREVPNHMRRGSVRRTAPAGPGSRKPPCAFFPSGRCRNGDACKFPHIMPEVGESATNYYGPKVILGRARAQTQPHTDHLNEKMAGLNLRQDTPPATQANGQSQSNGYTRPNFKSGRHEKRGAANGRSAHHQHSQQRVPSADEFPVLTGSVTPPARSPIAHPLNGPTAAEVLKAPAPARTEKAFSEREDLSSGPSEAGSDSKDTDGAPNGHVNGVNGVNMNGTNVSGATEIKTLSFAAVATVAPSPPESASTVSVTA